MVDTICYERVISVLRDEFDLECSEVRPIGRQHNNVTVICQLLLPTQKPCVQKNSKPGTVAIPCSTKLLMMQMPNAMQDNLMSIENQVAMMQIIRPALTLNGLQLVPEVYGWSDCAKEGRWLIEEYKEGIDLHTTFARLNEFEKRTVLRQLALIVRRLQHCEIPSSFQGYGSAGFDYEGNVVNKSGSIALGGPFETLTELYEGMWQAQLKNSDSSALLQGWRVDSLRTRLERFGQIGIAKVLHDDRDKMRVVVHGDICLQNVVFDPQTLSVTGLFDYELSYVASPVEEFLHSFHDVGGILSGVYGEAPEDLALRDAILYGFPDILPTTLPNDEAVYKFGSERHVQWDIAKIWDEELEHAGVLRPRTLPAADRISRLYWFLQEVCQFYFLRSRWLSSQTETQLAESRLKAKKVLQHYLDYWGF